MPPKTTTATNTNNKKTEKTEKTEKKPAIQLDDFFTKYIYKKKRNLSKRLLKIETIEKTSAAELNKEQRETIASKAETAEKIRYFDHVLEQYYEAFSQKDDKDEDAPANSAPKQAVPAEEPAQPQQTPEQLQRLAAQAFGNLVAVSTFAQNQLNRQALAQASPALAKQVGPAFLEQLSLVWRGVTEGFEVENSQRVSEITKTFEHYITRSALLSSAANLPYNQIFEAVEAVVADAGFLTATNQPAPAHPNRHVHVEEPVHHQAEELPVQSEVKMVKSSKPSTRKESKRSRIHSEVEETAPAQHAHHEPAPRASDFHKKEEKRETFVDPDQPHDDEDEWFPAKTAARPAHRGHRGGDRGFRGNRGPRPDRPAEGAEGGERQFRERRGPREGRPRGGYHAAEGDRPEGEETQTAEDGEKRDRPQGERRGRPDGERRGPRPDGERRGGRPDGERRYPRTEGEGRPEGERRYPRTEGEGRPDGERRGPRPDGERRGGRPDGERRGGRPDGERRGSRPEGDRRPRGGNRPETTETSN